MTHPPGVICFSLGDIVRYMEFVVSLQRTIRPEGTVSSYAQSVSIPDNMNRIIRAMPPEAQWLWIQADDQIWDSDALMRLLDRELDVVVPFIIRRGPPFVPVINKQRTRARYYEIFPYAEIPKSGLLEVHSAGTGGMLIRRHVIEAIKERQGHDRIFEVEHGDKLAPDYVLCGKIREAGFSIHCDLDVTMGHQSAFAVWPEAVAEGWRLRFDMGRTAEGVMSSFYYATDQQQTKEER